MEEQEVQSLLTCINSNLEYFPLTWDYRLQFTIGFFGGPQLRFELDSEKMYNLILANAQDEMIIPIHTKTNNLSY